MLDEAKILELKSKHPNLVAVRASNGTELVFRMPKRLEFDQWHDNREKGSQPGLSLARQCLVYPAQDEMIAALDDQPALLMCKDGIVDAITDLAGADGGASQKKL